MNNAKREILKGCINIIGTISLLEKQDLADTPDNIENSEAADFFRENIQLMDGAIANLLFAIKIREDEIVEADVAEKD